MRKHRPVVLAAAVLAVSTWGGGHAGSAAVGQVQESETPLHLGLSDVLRRVLEVNPALQAVEDTVTEKDRDADATSRTRWGALHAVFSYSRLNDNQVVRPISRELLSEGFSSLPFDKNQLHYGLTFQLPLYLGGKLSAEIAVAQLDAEKAQALLQGTRWQLRLNAVSLYSAAQGLDATTSALDEELEALKTNDERLRLMVAEGKLPEVDHLKVIEELESVRAERAAVSAQRIKVASLLLALLDQSPRTQLEVDPLPDTVPHLAVATEEIWERLESTSAVRRARLSVEQTEKRVTIARGGFLPEVTAHGSYLKHDAPSLDESLDTWELSIGVKVPLLEGGSRFARLDGAQARRQAAERNLEKTRLETASSLREALALFEAAQAKLTAARARVDAAHEAARIEQIRYETGAGNVEDLLRTLAREETAKAALAQAAADTWTAAERINSIVETEAVK